MLSGFGGNKIMVSRKQTVKALTGCASLAAIIVAAVPGMALAQAAAPAAAPEVIVVTGSRIATRAERAISPVQVIDGDQLRQAANISIDEFLKEQNQFASSTGQTTSPALLESHGASTLDMRGLGQNRTLVLVNGQRAAPNGFRNSVDINTIPSVLISRIETLTGGAAAVYGADAVAGVTNFILKDSYEGVQIDAFGNIAERGDNENYTVGVTAGRNFLDDRANLTAHVSFTERGAMFRNNRDWASPEVNDAGLPLGGPLTTVGGQFTRPTTAQSGTTINTQTGPGFNLTSVGGSASATTFFFNRAGNVVTTNPNESLDQFEAFLNPQDRTNISLFGRFEVSDALKFYGRYQYAQVNNESQVIPVSAQANSARVNATNRFDAQLANSIIIRSDNPFIDQTPGLRAILTPAFNLNAAGTALAVGAPAPGEVRSMRLNVNRVMAEFGPRFDLTERETRQIVLGFKGDLTSTISYDVSYVHGENTETVDRVNAGVASRYYQAANVTVDSSGRAVCVDASNGCVALNLFGPNKVSAEAAAWVGGGSIFFNQRNREQTVLSAVVTGDTSGFFELPAGPVGWSVGAERREEWGNTLFGERPQQATTMATGANGFRLDGVAEYDLSEVYAELRVPILSGVPLVQQLDFEGAYRYSDHSQAGTYDTWKLGAVWELNDAFRIRGSKQSVVRGANIGELFPLINFPSVATTTTDPCFNPTASGADAALCLAAGAPAPGTGAIDPNTLLPTDRILNAVNPQGGNSIIRPEQGETYTYGFVFTPQFLRGFSFILDYYNISLTDVIGGITPTDRLNLCYVAIRDLNDPICQSITRSRTAGPTLGTVTQILGNDVNISSLSTSGWDFSVYYNARMPEGLPGDRINIAYTGGLVESFTRQADFRQTVFDCAGKFGGGAVSAGACTDSGVGVRAIPEFRSNLQATWSVDDLSLRFGWRYFGQVDLVVPNANLVQHIDSQMYFDLGASYRFNDNLRASFSVTNLADEDPPVLGSSQQDANTIPGQYDIVGRRYGLTLVWRM
jgi:iron complex outermembrane recepter protein